MSDATEAAAWDNWNRWGDSVTQTPMIREAHRAGFAAGQMSALEDTANEIHTNGDSWAITENVPPNIREVVSNVLWGTADYVRARAAELSKETP